MTDARVDANIDARADARVDARADATTDARVDANRALWNEWTAVHEASAFYDLAAFKAGRDTLRPLEVAELGDVSGRTLLHLMCHFGQDTLCWARRGARVTGADGWWYLPDRRDVPLSFSLRAHKPAR